MGPFNTEGLTVHPSTSRGLPVYTIGQTHFSVGDWMQIKARLLIQRHPHPSSRKLRVEGGSQTSDDYIKVAPCLFCPQGKPDILGHHSIRSHFFGIEGKREISLPVRPRLLLSAALQDTS